MQGMRIRGLLRGLGQRAFDPRGWWMTAALGALAAVLRLPNLGQPHEFSFDETYYAKDAFSYLHFGYEKAFVDKANELLLAGNTAVFKDTPEFVVHPPLGKWAIALGEQLFGMNPVGWRSVVAVLGILAVVILHRTTLRLTGNVYTAALAGLFFAIDGLAIVMSRTALLDQVLMFFIVCTFHALVRDRDHYEHTLATVAYDEPVAPLRWLRPWRLLAIVCITAAFASKWSALWFALGFALLALGWDVAARRRHEYRRASTWLADIAWVVGAAALALVGYLATWIGWFRSTSAWDRAWTDGPQWLPQALRALLYYHQQALDFHVGLTSDHPYKAAPYWWPLMLRPTSFSYNSYSAGQQGCGSDACSAEVLALGNVIIWWTACLVIVALLLGGLAHLLRMRVEVRGRAFDFTVPSRVGWSVVSGPLVGFAAGWLPWIYWHNRTTFTFYSIVFAPFMFILAAHGLTLFATRRVRLLAPLPAPGADGDPAVMAAEALVSPEGSSDVFTIISSDDVDDSNEDARVVALEYDDIHERRFLIAVTVVALAVGFSLFFYPIWVGSVLPYSVWHSHMWLPSWI